MLEAKVPPSILNFTELVLYKDGPGFELFNAASTEGVILFRLGNEKLGLD